MSATRARRHYGFEQMAERSVQVEKAMVEVQQICETVEDIAKIQNKALLSSFGISIESSDSSDESEPDDVPVSPNLCKLSPSLLELCRKTLAQSNYNWFQLQEVLETEPQCNSNGVLEKLFRDLPTLGFTKHHLELIAQSKEAHVAAQNDACKMEPTARALNGCIVTEPESDDPELIARLHDPLCESGQLLIAKRRKAIQRRTRHLRAKAVAERRFLSKKSSTRISRILSQCPDIGKVIESFVSEHNIGADAWHRTSVLTFDGNTRLPKKVTYERICLHLQDVYKHHFSYGSVVQFCVARNKRRLSAKRYHGVAKVTTRRARKGFTLKYNPDTHWSATFYKGLNSIQLKDGHDFCLVNRDDAMGFRLDTLTTCKQYGTPTVKGSEVLTTRTDYVSKYASTLQTTSYNFTSTQTTAEICVGVVKAPSTIHPKNPCQHSADLALLERLEELQPAFLHPDTGAPKAIDCVRVDGASDEGPKP